MPLFRNSPESKFPISDAIGRGGAVPSWQELIELESPGVLKTFRIRASCLVNLAEPSCDDAQPLGRFRFFDVVFGRFDTLQRNAYAQTRVAWGKTQCSIGLSLPQNTGER